MNDFDQARALFLSYALEGAADSQLPAILMQVRAACGDDAFNRLLVLAAATDDPRFDTYGAADVLYLLRALPITPDVNADAQALLDAMREEDTAQLEEARRKAAEVNDPYRRAAVKLLRKVRNPNLAQVERELDRL